MVASRVGSSAIQRHCLAEASVPLPLLKESRLNHMGKLAFRWIYWNLLLKGRWIPIPALMSMSGKNTPQEMKSEKV